MLLRLVGTVEPDGRAIGDRSRDSEMSQLQCLAASCITSRQSRRERREKEAEERGNKKFIYVTYEIVAIFYSLSDITLRCESATNKRLTKLSTLAAAFDDNSLFPFAVRPQPATSSFPPAKSDANCQSSLDLPCTQP